MRLTLAAAAVAASVGCFAEFRSAGRAGLWCRAASPQPAAVDITEKAYVVVRRPVAVVRRPVVVAPRALLSRRGAFGAPVYGSACDVTL